jgi:hypothetical protein
MFDSNGSLRKSEIDIEIDEDLLRGRFLATRFDGVTSLGNRLKRWCVRAGLVQNCIKRPF